MSFGTDVFKGIFYYVSPSTSLQLLENNETMISLLNSEKGTEMQEITKDTTHIICNATDYDGIRRWFDSDGFYCCVIPKWVFISQSLHYRLPTVNLFPMIHS